jgi:hypothetical protein
MNDQNTDAAKNAAELEEERMHPIFDECEVNDFGEVKREHMLSMNGMYISGITDDQLKEMHGKLTELLTGEKPRKYYYGRASIPVKDRESNLMYDFAVEVIDGDKFPLMDCLHYIEKLFESVKETHDLSGAHITTCFEISKKDYEEFRAYRKK